MTLAYVATMIRPRFPTNSIVAQVVSVPTYLHSLDPNRKFSLKREVLCTMLSVNSPRRFYGPVGNVSTGAAASTSGARRLNRSIISIKIRLLFTSAWSM
jgi:hypothetical protein